MPEIVTDWRRIDTDATWTDAEGRRHFVWPWIRYNDDEIAVDIAESLAEGESPTNLEAHLWLLKATTEPADADADDLLVGGPVASGTTVKQRMAELAYPRKYRLYLVYGPAGNRRTTTAVIEVQG